MLRPRLLSGPREVELDGTDMLQTQSTQLCGSPRPALSSPTRFKMGTKSKMVDWNNVRLKFAKESVEVDEWVPENQHFESVSGKMEKNSKRLSEEVTNKELKALKTKDQVQQQ